MVLFNFMRGRKACKGCGIVKVHAEFDIAKRNLDNLHCFCKVCRAGQHQAKRAAWKEENQSPSGHLASIRINLMRELRFCSGCHKTKPIDQFSMRKKLVEHHQVLRPASTCFECSAKHAKNWYYRNTARAVSNNKITVLRTQVVKKLGSRCANPACLVPGGCTDIRALQIDHVNNDGAEERKKYSGLGPKGGQKPLTRHKMLAIYTMALEDTEGRYQLLCANCNVIKEHARRQEKYRQRREAHHHAA